MKIKILIATHKKYKMPNDKELYLPMHVGAEGKEDIGYLRDDTGENISSKNPYFCELTGLYWMWKNLDAEYCGLVHYRRYFTCRPAAFRLSRDKFKYILTQKNANDILGKTDIVVPKKRRYYIESIYSHYAHTHYAEHIHVVSNVISELCPEYTPSFNKVMKRRYAHMFNMMIMKKYRLDEYCSWLFPILFSLEERIDISEYDSYQARLFGRISEILLDVWLDKNQYAYFEARTMNMEKINWKHKILAFLKAKIKGQKYERSF